MTMSDRITTDLERKLDGLLATAVESLRLIEHCRSRRQARAIAQAALDQLQAATVDKEDQSA